MEVAVSAMRAKPVPRRNRYDVKFFFSDGASLRWQSTMQRSLSVTEMIEGLRDILEVLENQQALEEPERAT